MKIKENKNTEKYLDQAKAETTLKHEGDSNTNCSWSTKNGSEGLKSGLEQLEVRKNRNNPDHCKISQDIVKSSGDLKRLADTQTSVKPYQLKLERKTRIH